MGSSIKAGVSLDAHYRQLAKSGVNVERLLPQLPRSMVYLLQIFNQIGATRTYGMSAPNPISYGEFVAWGQLYGVELQGWEIETVRMLDKLWLQSVRKK